MSASLVGSEMCIRDRRNTGAKQISATQGGAMPSKTSRQAHGGSRLIAPVSYTHLTLPTICSV
eukprot:5534166-Alexandrium_andersonii.AAC.1